MSAIRKIRRLKAATLATALACAALPSLAQQGPFSQTVFFGDSLTDAGYFRPLLPLAAQPVIGQFTTNPGLVWSQFLADYYRTDASTAWLATGRVPLADKGGNYAVGGARVGTEVNGALGYTPSLSSQLAEHLRRGGGRADADALYTVWGGANDLFAVTNDGADPAATLAAAVGAEVGVVDKLHAAGARYILVPTVPDIGITPAFRAKGAAAMAQGSALAAAYNDALFKGLAARNLRVIPLDTYRLLGEVVADPGTYGFRNVSGTACQPQITAQSLACNPTSYVSPDAPYTYAFADGVHPGSAAHAILADYAVATIEGPRQVAVLPHSAATVGRQRADRVAEQLASRGDAEGGRFWGGLRYDNQRYPRGAMVGDGFEGGGASLGLGYDRNAGAWVYGGYLDAGRQRIDYGARRGDFRQREIGLGGYVGWRGDNAWFDGQLGYSKLQFDVSRQVPLGPATRGHDGRADGRNLSAGLGAGWRFGHDGLRHGPLLRVLAQKIRVDGYAESRPELATALSFPSQAFDSLQVSAGWQAEWMLGEHTRPYARLTAEREFGDRPEQAFARMSSMPGTPDYAVPAPRFDDRYGRLGLGVRTRLSGMDVLAGAELGLGERDGRRSSFHLGLAKGF
ncbi:autotransporter domain-containing protein [Lysobacter pythonis]|uniref:Autotransporter domain-containing protein n=1 Tax=Solilutibacter pythonis TaxID=2483112 RepID=A0A3M2HPU1_9GAMM|nr:autotransporter domain-containing protein [Lysobacter pythonis]RMH91038.1 autotransporter domain-containing protein [Lysobacter pythonis]